MNTVQRIAKNMVVLFVARIASMLFGFFYVMYTARYLGPANYGILAFALALNGIFGVIANFGLDPLTVREVARGKSLARKYLANGIVLKLMFGSLTFLIVFLVVNLLGYPEITRKVVYIITLSTIIAGISNLFKDIYQAFERMEFMSIGQILQSMLSLVFAITAIKLGLNVVHFAMIYLIANLVVLGYHVVITAWKFLKPKIEVDLSFWKSVVREAWPFALSAVFISIYYWMDSVMLSYMKGDEAVGLYNAAYRIISLVLIIPWIYFTSVFPLMSRTSTSKISWPTFEFILNKSWRHMNFLGFLIGFIIVILSKNIIEIVFEQSFLPSAKVLKILIWAPVFVFLNQVYWHLFNATDKQVIGTKMTALGALINSVLNVILIPKFSYIGAAIATVVTELVILIVEVFVGLSEYEYYPNVLLTFKVVIIGLLSSYIGMTISTNPAISGFVFLLLYTTFSYIAGIIREEDIKLLCILYQGKEK
ncbi:MAG: flippase [Candidatus Marinimicrobia bacterium]|nr:flippase [Candidatus Neomarinimicrobiota bacterium]